MLVSHRWLSDYVAHGLTPDALADALTHAGLEVESVETTGPRLAGVVVGHVLTVVPHPDADRLRVCTVDLGTPESPVQIVCGAPNVAAGQAVPVATVGTELMLPARNPGAGPGQAGLAPVTIKAGTIRGVVSNGMICAEDELGLGESHDGILVLDEDAPAGTPFADYLAERGDLPGDAVLDVSITPNRPDATSYIGIARDVAALTGQPLRLPAVDVPAAGGEAAGAVAVAIEDDGCHRYAGLVVRGVTVGPSPDWLRERLEAAGVRSINNVVDVTNFVLYETGQPLHAFDLATLAPGTDGRPAITVRAARAGETLVTLDGQSRTLPDGALVIADGADGARAVALAGVMGGRDTEVTDATRDVLLESAYFDPSRVRRAARALGLHTDAAYRFERGVDPTGQAAAAARAAALLVEIAGGTLVPGLAQAVAAEPEPRTVRLRPARVARVLGAPVPDDEAERLLTAIGFGVARDAAHTLDAFAEAALRDADVAAAAREATHAGWTVTVPPFRPDVSREIDVIEEVARLRGFGRGPLPTRTAVPLVPATDEPAAQHLDAARARLAALGLHEIASNSLLPHVAAARFADAGWTGHGLPPVETLNPISQEMAALRPSLLPGLIAAATYNAARGAAALRLMEAGTVYARGTTPRSRVDGYHEHTALGLALAGTAEAAAWDRPARPADFFDLKGLVASVLDGLGVAGMTETPRLEPDALTDYALVLSAGGTRLGVIARVSASAAPDLETPLFAAELDWDAVAALGRDRAAARYRPFARVPAVERDLALVVPEAQPVAPLVAAIERAGAPLLQRVRLFDRYRGPGVPEGHQSLAFALRFAGEATLTDADVDGRMRRIVGAAERQFGATLRG